MARFTTIETGYDVSTIEGGGTTHYTTEQTVSPFAAFADPYLAAGEVYTWDFESAAITTPADAKAAIIGIVLNFRVGNSYGMCRIQLYRDATLIHESSDYSFGAHAAAYTVFDDPVPRSTTVTYYLKLRIWHTYSGNLYASTYCVGGLTVRVLN